ncbi:MAG: hypothetical protein JKY56_17985 [Kofleriaceae bacterium]|nr:hypothetical protein [Kofleriaceae bacterium]
MTALISACATAGEAPKNRYVVERGANALSFVQGSIGFAGFESAEIRQIAMTYPLKNASEVPPISLTAADGTGLAIESLSARIIIEGPLAFTELHLRFRNPRSQETEGRFQITLPDGASVSRLSMRIEDGWHEAEIVEKMAARRAYEDFLHKKQDPMLLEKEAGNRFQARIFPIPASGHKDVILSFLHELPKTGVYRLPLLGLPTIGVLKVEAKVAISSGPGGTRYRSTTMRSDATKPKADFTLTGTSGHSGLRYKNSAVVRVAPKLPERIETPKGMTILFDTSASRAPVFAQQVARLGTLLSAIASEHGDRMPITVAAFDQEVMPVYDGTVGGFGDAEMRTLLARRPLGASNVEVALQWAGKQMGNDRVLLIGDAVSTAGDSKIGQHAKSLPEHIRRIDVLLVGGVRNREAAERLVRKTRARDGAVLHAELSDDEIARRLGLATSSVDLHVVGASWTWPAQVDGMQAGDEVVVYAGFSEGTMAPAVLEVVVGGAEAMVSISTQMASAPLLERSVAQAQIARLQSDYEEIADSKRKTVLRSKIVALSTKHRVLSEHTALLVLESEADYARFGIDRSALTDVIRIGPSGFVAEQKRRQVTVKIRGEALVEPELAPRADDRERAPTSEDIVPVNSRPRIDTTTTSQDVVLDRSFLDNLPTPGRSFESVLTSAAGAQDGIGVSFSGSSSLQSQYFVDGVNTTGLASGTVGSPIGSEFTSEFGRNRWPLPSTGLIFSHGRINDYAPGSSGSGWEENRVPKLVKVSALVGKMDVIHKLLATGNSEAAIRRSLRWRNDEPGNVLALVALGESLELAGVDALAARTYGSIIDLFPGRADMRRFASARLARLQDGGLALSIDSLRKALEQRPDHLTVYRLLAISLLRSEDYSGAFDALEKGLSRKYPDGRFLGGMRVLREDIGIIAAAWIAQKPEIEKEVRTRLKALGSEVAASKSLRFVLNWETDANDVDLHVIDSNGGHAFYGNKTLASGGELFADVTTGYGPECFAVSGKSVTYPYNLQVHYYSRGPMGYGMGQVEIMHHDGKGHVEVESRPFVAMKDKAMVDLGFVEKLNE